MTILRNRRLNGRAYLLSLPTSSTSGGDDQSFMMGTPGTTGSSSGSPGSAMSQAFTVTNWGTASSLGQIKRGVWFKKGDVPAGSIPVLANGTGQFYGVSYWKDGSLKLAKLLLRDGSLAAGASRSYTMTAASGALPAGSTAAPGNAGLAAALAGHDVKASFANVQTWDCASTSGNYAALGSGAFTASLATHAAVGTRCTLLTTGAVADVWQLWGMATDNATGAADAHLKVNWYVTRWKNADGSTLGLQVGAVAALDWWSVPNKYFLQYDAALADGSTTIVNYPGVKHAYQSQWIMCVNDGGLNAGTAPWIGATQPTLHCTFDRAYAVATGLIPPLDTAKRPTPVGQFAYVPGKTVADPTGYQSHRENIDGAGGYLGRGVIPMFDSDAFMAGTPQAYAVARTNALSGLGVPYHYRSNRTRTRPGESAADIANTIIPLLMLPKSASYSDFTAQGLPVAVHAYTSGNASDLTNYYDGFTWQTGMGQSANPNLRSNNFVDGETNGWALSLDQSHAVSYCYYMALVSGDEWLVEAQIDLAMNMCHQGIYGYHQNIPAWSIRVNSSTPSSLWTGLHGQAQEYNQRSNGWSQLVPGHALALCPADNPARGFLVAWSAHNGDYIGTNLQYLPSDFKAAGFYSPPDAAYSVVSPWMIGIISTCAYSHYLGNEDTRWQQLGDWTATWALAKAGAGLWYQLDSYRCWMKTKSSAWDATANPMIPAVQQGTVMFDADYSASSNRFTNNYGTQWAAVNSNPPPIANGDRLQCITLTDGNGTNTYGADGTSYQVTIPNTTTEGQTLYVVNLVPGTQTNKNGPSATPPVFQLAATPGGTPLTFGSSDQPTCNFAYSFAAAGAYPVAQATAGNNNAFPYLPEWDNYVPISISVIMMARQAGNAAATATLRDAALAFTAPMDGESSAYYSAYDMAAQ